MSNSEARWYVCTYCHQPLSKCGGNHNGDTYSGVYRFNLRVDALRADLEAAQARIAALTAVIEQVEWVSDGFCPWCHGNKNWLHFSHWEDGGERHHAPDCPRQAALGKKTEA